VSRVRVGLFGGTFDPIHHGHLRSAEEIWEDFELDQVVIIPAYLPPHKEDIPVTTFEHRLRMCQLAAEHNQNFVVSDMESKRQGKSFSIDTLSDFKTRRPNDRLHFILGMDAFLDILTWQDFRDLFSLSHFIVMARPGYSRSRVEEVLENVSPEFRHDPRKGRYLHPSGQYVYFWETTLLDISSTRIRHYVKESKSIRYLLPENVEEYIYSHGLYR